MGIIMIFMLAAAILFCFLATMLAGGLVLAAVSLAHDHRPAWRWVGAIVMAIYGGALLYRYWKPNGSDADVPEGLRETWNQVGAVVRLWPLPPALVATTARA